MCSSCQTHDLSDRLAALAAEAERALQAALEFPDAPQSLVEAMRYAVLGGGKRLRPALVVLSHEACGGAGVSPMPASVAIEMIHSYSLVHDDLPAMDDDSLRRGQPTVHVKFGEPMAILVGDALLTRAFEILSRDVPDSAVSARLAGELARGAGAGGMIAGQVADMGLCALPEGRGGLEYIHTRKTSALIAAACRMGAICAGAAGNVVEQLGSFGMHLGLAFQVIDDILDVTSTPEQLGKTPGKDAAADKRTYPALVGLDESRRIAAELSDRAVAVLDELDASADALRALANLMLKREC